MKGFQRFASKTPARQMSVEDDGDADGDPEVVDGQETERVEL